jgi:hypothetical protein
MYKLFRAISVFLMLFGLSSCGPSSLSPAAQATQQELPTSTDNQALPTPSVRDQELPKLTGDWHLRMEQSGGIAGISRTLEISSNGETTITDAQTKKQSVGQLSADQIAQLTELVASSSYKSPLKKTSCADCFIYNLQIDNGGKIFQAQVDELSLRNSGLEPLIGFLGELLNSKKP